MQVSLASCTRQQDCEERKEDYDQIHDVPRVSRIAPLSVAKEAKQDDIDCTLESE